jgi:hypothetical protein
MRRRSRASGKSPSTQAPKAAGRKSSIAPKAVHPRSASAANLETEITRLARERDEALEQQAATLEVLDALTARPLICRPFSALLSKLRRASARRTKRTSYCRARMQTHSILPGVSAMPRNTMNISRPSHLQRDGRASLAEFCWNVNRFRLTTFGPTP